jgi:hypothetical protein
MSHFKQQQNQTLHKPLRASSFSSTDANSSVEELEAPKFLACDIEISALLASSGIPHYNTIISGTASFKATP